MNASKCSVLLSAAMVAAASGQGILIGPSTLNGSFETGNATPWSGVQVVQDAGSATQGAWYGVIQGSSRGACMQWLSANPAGGPTFLASFDARDGSSGFDSLAVSLYVRNTDGTFVYASPTPLQFPSLDSSVWGSYEIQYQFPRAWDAAGQLALYIEFHKSGPASGTYTAYLDNVTLQQVPEPSTTALLGLLAAVAAGGQRLRKRWSNNTMQRIRASRLAQSQFGGYRRLARTADGDR